MGVGAAARSDVVMAAKKGGVNPALFSTGIKAKAVARGGCRKAFKTDSRIRAQDGSWKGNQPWLAGQKAERQKISPFLQLSASLGPRRAAAAAWASSTSAAASQSPS